MPSAVALADFVRKNARGGVLNRGSAEFQAALDDGVVVAVVESGPGQGGADRIWAVAGVFPLEDDCFELGGALVRSDRTGFGLQKPMIAARLKAFLSKFGMEKLSRLFAGAAYADYGWGSRKVLQAAGFEPVAYEKTPRELRADCPRCKRDIPIGARCCYQFYSASLRCADTSYVSGQTHRVRSRDGAELILDLPAV